MMMRMTTRKRNQRRKRNTKKESKAKVKAKMVHIKRKRCVASVILFTACLNAIVIHLERKSYEL